MRGGGEKGKERATFIFSTRCVIRTLAVNNDPRTGCKKKRNDRPPHVSRALNFATSDTHIPPGMTHLYNYLSLRLQHARPCTQRARIAITRRRRECTQMTKAALVLGTRTQVRARPFIVRPRRFRNATKRTSPPSSPVCVNTRARTHAGTHAST